MYMLVVVSLEEFEIPAQRIEKSNLYPKVDSKKINYILLSKIETAQKLSKHKNRLKTIVK